MRTVLALPLSTVERAGTGDLVSRTTADVDSLARTVRFAIPETLIAAVTTVLTVAAAVWVSPPAALALVAGVPALVDRHPLVPQAGAAGLPPGARRVRDARRDGRRDGRRRAAPSRRSRSREDRVRAVDADLAEAYPPSGTRCACARSGSRRPRSRTCSRSSPRSLWGGWLVTAGHASIGEVTAVVLYAQQLADPVDRLISWLDEIQVGGASLARLVGIEAVPPDRVASGREPDG